MGLNSNFRIGDNGEIIRLSDKPDDNQKNDGNNENGKKRKTGRFKTILIAALGLGLLRATASNLSNILKALITR